MIERPPDCTNTWFIFSRCQTLLTLFCSQRFHADIEDERKPSQASVCNFMNVVLSKPIDVLMNVSLTIQTLGLFSCVVEPSSTLFGSRRFDADIEDERKPLPVGVSKLLYAVLGNPTEV